METFSEIPVCVMPWKLQAIVIMKIEFCVKKNINSKQVSLM